MNYSINSFTGASEAPTYGGYIKKNYFININKEIISLMNKNNCINCSS